MYHLALQESKHQLEQHQNPKRQKLLSPSGRNEKIDILGFYPTQSTYTKEKRKKKSTRLNLLQDAFVSIVLSTLFQ